MKKIFLIVAGLLMTLFGNAQTLSDSMQEFVNICLKEREILTQKNLNNDTLYKQLAALQDELLNVSAKEDASCLHPRNEYSAADFRGHILFSPTYIEARLDTTIDEPDITPPYAGDYHKGEYYEEADICYFNSLVSLDHPDSLSYKTSHAEQQLVVIAENNTPLEIEILSDTFQRYTICTDRQSGVAQLLWKEGRDESVVSIRVRTLSEEFVSYVIAVY